MFEKFKSWLVTTAWCLCNLSNVVIFLEKTPQFIQKLELADWFYLNNQQVQNILAHFEWINTLNINNFHNLVTLPKQPFILQILQKVYGEYIAMTK